MKIKQERVASIIKRNVAEIIQFQLNDPNVGLVTVTDVKLTNDYSIAKIYIMISGTSEDKAKGLDALRHAKGYIRSELAKDLAIFKTPDLVFMLDDSLEKYNRLTSIIEQANK